jgi:hypothetical protein
LNATRNSSSGFASNSPEFFCKRKSIAEKMTFVTTFFSPQRPTKTNNESNKHFLQTFWQNITCLLTRLWQKILPVYICTRFL